MRVRTSIAICVAMAASVSAQSSASATTTAVFRVVRQRGPTPDFLAAADVRACFSALSGEQFLGRVNLRGTQALATVALSPAHRAATLGTDEHRALECMATHLREVSLAAGDEYTVEVAIRSPSVARGVGHVRSTARLTHPLVWNSVPPATPRQVVHSGRIDAALVVQQIAERRPEVAACFHQALAIDPETPASFEADIHVSTTGAVVDVRVVESAHIGPVSGCIFDRVRSWMLGPPEGGEVTVRHRFTADLR